MPSLRLLGSKEATLIITGRANAARKGLTCIVKDFEPYYTSKKRPLYITRRD